MLEQLPRIMATFQPQKDFLRSIVPDGEAVQFDITEEVLGLPVKELLSLRDDTFETDQFASLCPRFQEHNGPFAVRVESALETWLEQLAKTLGKGHAGELTESDLVLGRLMVVSADDAAGAPQVQGHGLVKTEQEYVENRDGCPCCGSSEISTEHLSFEVEGKEASQVRECDACHARWLEEFQLVGFTLWRGAGPS